MCISRKYRRSGRIGLRVRELEHNIDWLYGFVGEALEKDNEWMKKMNKELEGHTYSLRQLRRHLIKIRGLK